MSEHVLYEVAGGVATITMNDPETRNSLSAQMVGGLLEAFGAAGADQEVGCVVLRSSHEKVFSSGANLGGFSAEVSLVEKHFASEGLVKLFDTVGSMEKPTICAAGGHVLAGAFGVALSCDLIIASENATFGTPEINVGVFPFMVMALLYRNLARKQANEMLLLGERIDAERARELGLVNRVVAKDKLEETVAEWAVKLAGKSPVVMRLGKQAMRRQMDMDLDDALAFLRSQLTLTLSTEDVVEGVTAFFQKRKPNWKGR